MSPRKRPTDLFLNVLRGYLENDPPCTEADPAIAAGFHEIDDNELNRDPSTEPPPIDYAQLFDATRQVGHWFLDIARSHTNDPDDLAAIERVQTTMRANFDATGLSGRARASEEDLLVVLGILITAFEVDFRVPGLGSFAGSLYAATDGDFAALKRSLMDALVYRTACARSVAYGTRVNERTAGAAERPPIVIQRRPRIAHGADDLDGTPVGSVLIIR